MIVIRPRRIASFCLLLLGATLSIFAAAQTTSANPASTSGTHDALSPVLHGWNAGIGISGVHQSTTGWATLASPVFGYSFNDIFSVDATIPIYFFRLADSIAAHPAPDALLSVQRGELGDFILSGHAQFIPSLFQYQVTGAVTAPSGDEAYGLTTGRVTFDINNHIERSFGRFTPVIEGGGGDSTTLVNRIVNKNYTSLGPLAHFLVGIAVDLPRDSSFEADAYEQLPIGDQKIYGVTRHGHTIVTGHNAVEDNGFINSLDVPLGSHFSLSGYYSRSLRQHTDTTAIGISYVLRSPDKEPSTPVTSTTNDGLFRDAHPTQAPQAAP